MTQEEWIEAYKDEIWVPKPSTLSSCRVKTNRTMWVPVEPVRLITGTNKFEALWDTNGGFVILDQGAFFDAYEPLSAIGELEKDLESSKTEWRYRFREMFIPDDSFIHGRMCLGVIAVSEKSVGFESWINPERADYFRGIQMEQYVVDLYQHNWIKYVRARSVYLRAEEAFHGFPQEKRGIYISSKDMELSFCGEDRSDIQAQVVTWQRRYFEEANKKKDIMRNEDK